MIELLRLVRGYVYFSAEGGFTERFLNLCKLNGINLWNVRNDGVTVEAFTLACDYSRIDAVAEKSGMTVKTLREKGVKNFIYRHKLRLGAFFGLLISCGIVLFLSGCIWSVNVAEKEGVKAGDFTKTLEELGVKPGARKSKINISAVQEQVMEKHPELMWVSLNIFGGRAELEYSLVEKKSENPDKKIRSNVVAAKRGLVTLVECYGGTPVVREGQYVAEGSMLISAVVKNADGSETVAGASGKVFAKTENEIHSSCARKRNLQLVSSLQPYYGIYFFGLTIPVGRNINGDGKVSAEIPVKGNETPLPVGILRYEQRKISDAEVVVGEEQCLLTSLFEAVELKRKSFSDCALEKVSYAVETSEKTVSVRADIVCVEDISERKELNIEKTDTF